MSAIRYCPVCEAIVTEGVERCVMCGNDLRVNQAFDQPPSFYREQAQLAAQREAVEPSTGLTVMAWIAQVIGTIWFIFFCILPPVLIIVVVLVVLFTAGRS